LISKRIRSAIRWAASGRSFEAFVGTWERLPVATNVLRVLTYHRVDELDAQPDLAPQPLSATPLVFRQQMEFLAERYRVVSLDAVLEAQRNGSTLPDRSVLITFDDAYLDFLQHAFPVLDKLQLPATMFVPTAYPDHPTLRFWWDRLFHAVMTGRSGSHQWPIDQRLPSTLQQRASFHDQLCRYLSQLPWDELEQWVDELCGDVTMPRSVMSWDELRTVSNRNITLAPHTRTHPLLNRVTTERATQEILGSVQDLEQRIGHAPRVLAYPGGQLTDDVREMLRAEGFSLAFTTCRGNNRFDEADPLRLKRINVGYRCPMPLWRGQLALSRPMLPIRRGHRRSLIGGRQLVETAAQR